MIAWKVSLVHGKLKSAVKNRELIFNQLIQGGERKAPIQSKSTH
jgi:hypothetical protein